MFFCSFVRKKGCKLTVNHQCINVRICIRRNHEEKYMGEIHLSENLMLLCFLFLEGKKQKPKNLEECVIALLDAVIGRRLIFCVKILSTFAHLLCKSFGALVCVYALGDIKYKEHMFFFFYYS